MPKHRSATVIQQQIAEYERRIQVERDKLRATRDQAKPRGRFALAEWVREKQPAILKTFIADLKAEKRLGVLEDVQIWLGEDAAADDARDHGKSVPK